MKNITLSQEFLLCVLNKKGKISTFGGNCVPALTAAAVVELVQAGLVAITDKKACVLAPLPPELAHLRRVYAYIEEKQPVTLENIVGSFNFSFSQKAANGLFTDVKQALADSGCLCEVTEKPLLGDERTLLAPDCACVDRVIQKIRAELLEQGALDDATIALAALFEKTQLLKNYFSKYEASSVKQRIREIKKDPSYGVVSQMIDDFEAMLVVVIAAT